MSSIEGSGAGRSWSVRMAARDTTEQHRASTPLELLFDLTFVVAVGRVAAELAGSIAHDDLGHGLGAYLMVFFAIWWAWMNFTWFASAFDTDDVGYRLLTLLQMAGVLVLAGGVAAAFESSDFTAVVIGYLIMRVAMVGQWLRAAIAEPRYRLTARRYAAGILTVQLGWVLRLWLPGSLGVLSFLLLAAAEMSVPVWAERPGMTSWHPAHIAERHGLFTLIVLGECVLAASTAVEQARSDHSAVVPLVVLGAGALMLLFALWWLYYLRDPAEGLQELRGEVSFRWGYGHYGIFAALAAVGAGLEVTAEATAGHIQAPGVLVSYAVAVPACAFLFLLWFLHKPLAARPCPSLMQVLAAIGASLLIAGFGSALSPAWVVAALCLPSAGLVVAAVRDLHRDTSTGPTVVPRAAAQSAD
ncbi:MAG: low temperature requirement protein A [Jatrophihabitans sp.]